MRALSVILIVLAVLVDGFFAFINFYPVAPRRRLSPHYEVLVSLPPVQAKWFADHLIAEFNHEHDTQITVRNLNEEELVDALAAAEKSATPLLLASLPRARGGEAQQHALVRSFDAAIGKSRIDADLSTVRHKVMRAAELDGKQFFLPRYTLLDLLVYRVSRVRDAVRHWQLARAHIDAALKRVNGHGLPANYRLEIDPEAWDGYDRFVVAWYWAHRRYAGHPSKGRIAHRSSPDLDGVWDITEGVYRAGATDATISDTHSNASRDYFAWEALYRAEGLYHPAVYDARGVDDDRMLDLFAKGELNLATLDQMEAFTLHGGSHTGTPSKMEDPDDIAFSPMPRLSSLELDEHGHPVRAGQPFSFREDWVWALPQHTPNAELAYALVAFLWERENHRRECEAMGTLPLRMDVIRERASLFRLVWMDDIFDAVFAEWEHAAPLPEKIVEGLGSVYVQLWHTIVAEERGSTPAAIAAALSTPPPPRAHQPAPATPMTTAPIAAAPGEDSEAADQDEDAPILFDDELWRGKVELDLPPLAGAR